MNFFKGFRASRLDRQAAKTLPFGASHVYRSPGGYPIAYSGEPYRLAGHGVVIRCSQLKGVAVRRMDQQVWAEHIAGDAGKVGRDIAWVAMLVACDSAGVALEGIAGANDATRRFVADTISQAALSAAEIEPPLRPRETAPYWTGVQEILQSVTN